MFRALFLLWMAVIATPVAAKTVTIVALGDSLTAGLGLKPTEAFPARLESKLRAQGYDVRIVNAGLSGDTTSGGLARMDFSVPRGVDGVFIALGANDMLQGASTATAKANLDAMVSRLKGRKVRVALTGMRSASNWGQAYRVAFDGMYPALAKKHAIALDPFLLEGVALVPSLNQRDGIHPTATGADRIATRLVPFFVRAYGLKKR